MTEQEPGIYTVSGNVFFNIIILTTGSMDQNVVEQSNAGCAGWKEETGVTSFLAEAKNEGIQQGRAEERLLRRKI